MPTVVRKDLNNNHVILSVSVSRDELKPRLKADLRRYQQQLPIKGFRPGHAPVEHVKRMYGSSIFAEAVQEMIAKELYSYFRENKMEVLGQPLPTEDQKKYSFKIDSPEEEYTISYEVGYVPSFEVQGLDNTLEFERLTISNLDDLADEDLEYARKRMGKRSNPENDIQENDVLKIDASEEGGDWQTTVTILMKDVPSEALKAEFLTKKKGDSVRFNVHDLELGTDEKLIRKFLLNIPDDDDRQVGDWFTGVISEVSRVETAEMNEEFFQGYFGGGVETAEQAREEVKKGIRQFYDVRSNALLMRAFQARLLEINEISLPDEFLKKWLEITNEGKITRQDIESEYDSFAENLRWTLIRDSIIDDFGIEVNDEEVRQSFFQKVRNYFKVDLPDHLIKDTVAKLMKNKEDVDKTKRDLELDKLFECIRSFVNVTDRAIPSGEFHAILDHVTGKAKAEQAGNPMIEEALEAEV